MKTFPRLAVTSLFSSMFLTGCLTSGGSATGESSVMVTEVMTICGALVGEQAEQRINSEWEKYPEANASRPVIETMAQVLLTNPENPAQQGASDYKKYISCATGLLMANGLLK